MNIKVGARSKLNHMDHSLSAQRSRDFAYVIPNNYSTYYSTPQWREGGREGERYLIHMYLLILSLSSNIGTPQRPKSIINPLQKETHVRYFFYGGVLNGNLVVPTQERHHASRSWPRQSGYLGRHFHRSCCACYLGPRRVFNVTTMAMMEILKEK